MSKDAELCYSHLDAQTTTELHEFRRNQPLRVRGCGNSKITFESCLSEGHIPDRNALIRSIKSCGKQKDLCKATTIHATVLKENIIPNDILVSITLLHAFAKCGAPAKAQEVFDQLPVRDVMSWTALITAYSQRGFGDKALECFKQMQGEGVVPDGITYTCILKACGSNGVLVIGEIIHLEIEKKGLLQKDARLGAALVDMYAKCGVLTKAQEVFERLPVRNVVSWTVLITGYVQRGFYDIALECFVQMQNEGCVPDAVAYVCILKACGSVGSFRICEDIDAAARKQRLLEKNIVLGNTLMNAYAKCGVLEKVRELFELLPVRNIVSWNVLLTGYAQHGYGDEIFNCFQQMEDEGIIPDSVTYICVLKACGMTKSLQVGEDIGAEVRRQGLLQKDIVLGCTLVDMYTKCGALGKAEEVFEQLPIRNVVAWTALIAGYGQHGQSDKALECFRKMHDDGVSPDAVTYISILKYGCIEIVEATDAEIRRRGLLQKEVVLGTSLLDMYVKHSSLEKARDVFEQLPVRNVVSWTALIAGYVQQGLGHEALKCFKEMQIEGVSPNAVTFICILKACGMTRCLRIGENIEIEIRSRGLLEDIVVGNALLGMYVKIGALEKAEDLFHQLPTWDVVSWNTLMTGYIEHEFGSEALRCFKSMQVNGFSPDSVTYICALKACGIVGSLEFGEKVRAKIREQGVLFDDIVLATALVDMYVKCAAVDKAQEIFEKLPMRNAMLWTTLMGGYAQLGQVNVVFSMFRKMTAEGIVPDLVTFLVVLAACNHGGLCTEAEKLFKEMTVVYCLAPTTEHYTCMIDLFSREGCTEKIQVLLGCASSSDYLLLYLSVLGACRKMLNVKVGQWAFEKSIQLDKNCAAAYTCMENIYATAAIQTEEHRRVESQAC